jgi:hypothetical protein
MVLVSHLVDVEFCIWIDDTNSCLE